MHIGINASFLRKPGTGIGQVTLSFLQSLAESEAGRAHHFILYLEEDADISFLPENFEKRVFLPFWKRDDLIRKILWEKRLARLAAEEKCEVFLSLSQTTTLFPVVKTKEEDHRSIRHIMIVHDIIPRLFPLYRGNMRQAFHWKLIERGIRAADHIIAVSEHTKSDLMRELAVQEAQISVAYPSIAPQFRENVSDEACAAVLEKYDLKLPYIYHGGGLEVRKNTETLLRAYKKLRDEAVEGGTIPPLVISGKIFPASNLLATPVEKIIRELKIGEHVRLLGFVPDADLPALYKSALFFVYPSLYEGFGLPVLEALQMGTPVIASDSSSIPEVGGEAVLLVDPADTDALVASLKRLASDESLRVSLRSKSQAQAAKFTWKIFVEKIWAEVEK